MLEGKTVLLVITGGIAAYKSIELIRLLQSNNAIVVPVMTNSAQQFIKPLSVAAIAGSKVYTELFDLTAEAEMGHIELSRSADIILVAPASADFLSKMAQGSCDDLASTLLLATDKPVLVAPSMNVRMWHHPATQRNLNAINDDGIITIGPNEGDMACGEFGLGRMSEPTEIVAFLNSYFRQGPLSGKRIIVTSGTTHEMIDPVRYIANRSSGEQGSAIASALVDLGANVIFITGPSTAPIPANVELIKVQSGREMHKAVLAQLPADVAIFVAAVSDWYIDHVSEQKIKKNSNGPPVLKFNENPDILRDVGNLKDDRPCLVIGFAAETEDLYKNAETKFKKKGCDWVIANDVSATTGYMGGDENKICLFFCKAERRLAFDVKKVSCKKISSKNMYRFGSLMYLTLKLRHAPDADTEIPTPKYETEGSSGADLRANFPSNIRNSGKILMPKSRSLIPTGLMMEIPPGHEVQIRPRSGLAIKNGITILNSPGTIDCDYRGEISVILFNSGDDEFKVSHGDRIAQLVVANVVQVKFVVSTELSKTARGSTGFGSTGID